MVVFPPVRPSLEMDNLHRPFYILPARPATEMLSALPLPPASLSGQNTPANITSLRVLLPATNAPSPPMTGEKKGQVWHTSRPWLEFRPLLAL